MDNSTPNYVAGRAIRFAGGVLPAVIHFVGPAGALCGASGGSRSDRVRSVTCAACADRIREIMGLSS